jgi:hypothetical protein
MATTDKNKSNKSSLKYQRDRDRQSVKGIFRFYEVPGGTLSFCYKKYKGDPVEKFSLRDGEVYTIPLGVAKHLNKNCNYPVHSYAQDESGKVSMRIGQKVNRCGFQSLEFMDLDDVSTKSDEIIKVDQVVNDNVFRK